jgi:HAD superfamily hydrolase (TIGR01490 family)
VSKPFAVFDIDGTLIRWQLYHAITDRLVRAGHIEPEQFRAVREARMAWKKRTGETSFRAYEHALVAVHDEAIQRISYDEYMTAVHEAFNEYKEQTYTYTRDLIRSLKQRGYALFAISASQAQVVELLAAYYEFDDFGGSMYEVRNGKFTGKKEVLMRDRKPFTLNELVKKHHVNYQNSIGVGDSESDIPMLEKVEHPIAFNPTKLLYEHAQSKAWPIVVERKNMVYKFEGRDGTYLLETPNS